MDRVIITDHYIDASSTYPGLKVVANIGGVLDLENGTRVTLHQVRVGTVLDGPIEAARLLIKRKKLVEVEQ